MTLPERPYHTTAWEDDGCAGVHCSEAPRGAEWEMLCVSEPTVCEHCGRMIRLRWTVYVETAPTLNSEARDS